MKKSFTIAAAALTLALAFTSCGDKPQEMKTSEPKPSVTEAVTPKPTRKPFASVQEDFFSTLDEASKNQINIMTAKLPEILGSYSYIYLTDLDGNGRFELILSDPGFTVYEISEDQKSLVQTVSKQDDFPSLYPVTDKLVTEDSEKRKHYIWKSVKDESETSSRENEKEYIYENGQLTEKVIRSRTFDKYQGNFNGYFNAEGAQDYPGYARALSDFLYRSNNHVLQCSIGILTAEDVKNADADTLKQLLSELKGFFGFSEPKCRYQYPDLEGTWIRKSGFSAGNDYFQNSDNTAVNLIIGPDSYVMNGSVQTEAAPVSLSLGGHTNTVMWYAELGRNSAINEASVRIENDGTLVLEGTAQNLYGQTVNVEWVFQKEGWDYSADTYSALLIPSETQPAVTETAQPSSNTENAPSAETPSENIYIPEPVPTAAPTVVPTEPPLQSTPVPEQNPVPTAAPEAPVENPVSEN